MEANNKSVLETIQTQLSSVQTRLEKYEKNAAASSATIDKHTADSITYYRAEESKLRDALLKLTSES